MAIAGRSEDSPAADSAADALREATFVRLLAGDDGDSLAAAGLLGRALAELGTPFHARVAERATEPTDDATTVHIGLEGGDLTLPQERPASETAFGVARDLDCDPDPVLALAGMGEGFEGTSAFEDAREQGIVERRPGVAVPVTDLADGLAHTTLVHAPFSGDEEATAAALDGRDDPREVASLLALSVANTDGATPRAAESVARALGAGDLHRAADLLTQRFKSCKLRMDGHSEAAGTVELVERDGYGLASEREVAMARARSSVA